MTLFAQVVLLLLLSHVVLHAKTAGIPEDAKDNIEDAQRMVVDSPNLDQIKDNLNFDKLNQVGSELSDKASDNLDQFGREANAALSNLGEEASQNLDKFGKDASKKLDSALSSLNGTVSDLSIHATKKGEETIDDIQQWIKDKLVFFRNCTIIYYFVFEFGLCISL